MQVTIVREDNLVVVDGRAIHGIDMTGLPDNLHAVQWDGTAGHEEWTDRHNTDLDDIAKYQTIIDRWQAAADEIDNPPPPTRDEALQQMLGQIDLEASTRNHLDFIYDKGDGTVSHHYEADDNSIQAVQNQCLTMTGTDPIPVPNGVWKTNDTEADGLTPVYVPFTVAEFLTFATAYFMRGSNNFGVKETHKNNVKAIYADDTKTVDDILNYDYSGGWY